VLTDGAKFVADEAGAYWLMDAIASNVGSYKAEGFVVVKLVKTGDAALLTLEDGNDNILARQDIEYTDFPLDDVTLYVIKQDALWVILLPSEY